MKMKLFLVACGIVLSLFTAPLQSQILKQTIRGQVTDIDTKAPLIGVTLYIEGSNPLIGTVTNTDGYFAFPQLPVGRYSIVINYVGYENKVVPNLLIGAGKEAVLNIKLTESVTRLDEVVVTARKNKGEPLNDLATVSARSFTVEETQRYAGSFDDPSRMVSSYAGVMGDPDGDNSIIIRGNSSRGLLWRVEGVDVPNPNHFANEGSTGGPISILNSTTLSNSDFLTGAFPADYGDAYSGVFDIKLRTGNNEKREYTAQAGIIGMELAAEGPFSSDKNASYLINYRYSSLALLNQTGIEVAGDAVPKFQDLTFNVNVPIQNAGNIKLFGIGGMSTIQENDPEYINSAAMDMGVIGINHILPISENTYLRTSIAATTSLGDWNYKERNDETDEYELKGSEGLYYINYQGAVDLFHKFSAKNSVKIGGSAYSKNYNLALCWYDYDYKRLEKVLDDNGGTELYQSYIAWKFRPVQPLTINSGAHFTYLALNGKQLIEPRIGMRWQLSPNHALTAGFGQHSRMENVSIYLAKVYNDDGTYTTPNKNLGFIRANHYVVGYNWRMAQNLNFKVECYYQELFNVPVEDDTASAFSILNESDGYIFTPLVNKGSGKNYGAEITLEKYLDHNFYFLVTTSLFESKYKAMDGIERNTVFNNNYVVNVVGGKEFPIGKSKNNALCINIRSTFAGGQYYSPIDPVASAKSGYTERPAATAFSKKRPAYMRADLKLSYRKNKKHTTRVWELDIENVTNTLNVTGDYWDDKDQKIEQWTQLGLLPVLSYRIEF